MEGDLLALVWNLTLGSDSELLSVSEDEEVDDDDDESMGDCARDFRCPFAGDFLGDFVGAFAGDPALVCAPVVVRGFEFEFDPRAVGGEVEFFPLGVRNNDDSVGLDDVDRGCTGNIWRVTASGVACGVFVFALIRGRDLDFAADDEGGFRTGGPTSTDGFIGGLAGGSSCSWDGGLTGASVSDPSDDVESLSVSDEMEDGGFGLFDFSGDFAGSRTSDFACGFFNCVWGFAGA